MRYKYKAKNPEGLTVRGAHEAKSEEEAASWLRAAGLIPLEIRETGAGGSPFAAGELPFLSPRIKLKDKAVFFRQLAVMTEAGIPLASALEVLAEQTENKRLRKAAAEINEAVSSGSTLRAALARYPKVFGRLVLSLVRAGEESGTLGSALTELSAFLEEEDLLNKKIISAAAYPAVVLTTAAAALGVAVAVVVPQFEKAFKNLNIRMPALTRAVFELGGTAREYWHVLPLSIAAAAALICALRRVRSLEIFIDAASLKVPVFGDIAFKASLARSFRTMSSLLRSGIPLLSALEMAGEAAGNARIKRSFDAVRESVTRGGSMSSAIKEESVFPPLAASMAAVGEETGTTDRMFEKTADWYDAELSEKIKRLSAVLEPVMVIFAGLVVGFMVMAVFFPIIGAIEALI